MLPVLQNRVERHAVKRQILDMVTEAGSGKGSALPADVIAIRLGWPASLCGTVLKLVLEIVVDGDDLLATCDSGVYRVVTSVELIDALAIVDSRLSDYRRVRRRLLAVINK